MQSKTALKHRNDSEKEQTFELRPDALSSLTQKIQIGLKEPINGQSQKAPSARSIKKKSEKLQKADGPVPKNEVSSSSSKTVHDGTTQKLVSRSAAPSKQDQGKKNFRDSQTKNQKPGEKGKTDVNSIKVGAKSARPREGAVAKYSDLEDEIMALGGNKEDLDLLEELDSDSEIDGETLKPDSAMGSLSKELQVMVKELGFDKVGQKDLSNVEDEDEDEMEADRVSQMNGRAPANTLQQAEMNGNRVDSQVNKTSVRPQSQLIFPSQPEWHAAQLPTLPSSSPKDLGLPLELSESLHEYAKSLLEKENDVYAATQHSKSSAQQFYATIMTTGTLSDKISALTLSVQESPVHNMKALETLVGLARKRSRGQAVEVLGALKDLFGPGNLLPSDRKLRNFAAQPSLSAIFEPKYYGWTSKSPLPKSLKEVHLINWAYEDWLKSTFFEVLKIIESWCNDEVVFARGKAVDYVCQLLKEKPEQEANLLRLLVNKLGDSDKKIASKTSFNILQLETTHPAMKSIIVSAIESDLLFRPGQSLHAQYYATITLNQTVLSAKEENVVKKLLNIYFTLFVKLLQKPEVKKERDEATGVNNITVNKKGQIQGGGGAPGKKAQKKKAENEKATTVDDDLREKMLSAVLTGINRAMPFTDTNDGIFEKHLDTLYRVTHSSNFNTSIQALMLIQQLNGVHQGSVDRFYRTLYESLLDPRLLTSSKQALYLNLLFRALRSDLDINRVKAFAKRLIQVVAMHQPSFTCGTLYLIRELESVFPSLTTFIDQAEEDLSDDEEIFHDVPENPSADHFQPLSSPPQTQAPSKNRPQAALYDGRKRDPLHANVTTSTLWEVHPLLHHYHPSVSLFASRLLTHTPMPPKPDLSLNTLIHFLDRFVYKNPKAIPSNGAAKGISIMQPLAANNDRSSILVSSATSGITNRQQQPVNSEAFWKQESAVVGADEVFFHRYFSTLGKGREKSERKKKKKEKKAEKDGGDGEEDEEGGESGEDEEEIWKALVDSRPELDEGSEGGFDSEDLGSGSEMDGLEDYSDGGSDDEVDIEGDDEDGGVDFTASGDADDVNIGEDGEDIPDFGDEDEEDALLGSDEELPGNFDDALRQDSRSGKRKAEPASAVPESKRGMKRRRLKNLPTFASVEDYAKMIDDEGGE